MSSMRGGLLMILAIAFTRAGAEYRCHHNIGQDYCAKCAPGEAPPGGGHRSSRTGKCEPYNNPGTECTAPMSVDDTFDARVTQDVATMYEGKLGIVPDQLACGKNASGGGLAVWELVNGTLQPCRAGLFRMMLDNDTNTSYHSWADNFEAWMEMHLDHLDTGMETRASGPWNFTAIPTDWSGVAYWDMESIKPLWDLELRGTGQGGPDPCKPLDGDGPCTANWGPKESSCEGCTGPALWYWADFVTSVTASSFPKALLTAAGFTAPDGASKWSDLKADEKLSLLKGTYNHFAERFIGGTMKKLKKLRPKAQWGIWSYPKGAHPSMDQWVNYRDVIPGCDSYGPNANPDFPCTNRSMFEAINDQLDWLYGEMDLLLPSLYGMGWVSDTPDAPCGPCGICQPNGSGHQLIPGFDLYTKHRANTYIRQAVKESVRIKKAQAAKGHAVKVLPFFTWHLASDAGSCSAQHTLTPARLANGTAVFIQPENLKEHFKLTKEEGADGMVVWGDAGPHVSARPGNPGEVTRPELVKYLHEQWTPLVKEFCDEPGPDGDDKAL